MTTESAEEFARKLHQQDCSCLVPQENVDKANCRACIEREVTSRDESIRHAALAEAEKVADDVAKSLLVPPSEGRFVAYAIADAIRRLREGE